MGIDIHIVFMSWAWISATQSSCAGTDAQPDRSSASELAALLDRLEARVGVHYLSRVLRWRGRNARFMPAKYVKLVRILS